MHNSNNQSTTATVNFSFSCSGVLYFIFFVFACVALTHSDKDTVYQACGSALRNWVIADLVMSIFFGIFACIFACIISAWAFNKEAAFAFLFIFSIGLFILCFCFSYYTLINTTAAMNNPDCTSALSSTVDKIDTPLLAYIGYVYGSLYALATFSFLITTISIACIGPWLVTVHN